MILGFRHFAVLWFSALLAGQGFASKAFAVSDPVITQFVASQKTIQQGEEVDFSADVLNQGNSPTSFLELDFEVCDDQFCATKLTFELGSLAEGESTSLEFSFHQFDGTGIFDTRVCLFDEESSENSICSSFITIEVLQARAPELVVDAVSADPLTVLPGQSFTLAVAVSNRGDVSADPSLGYFQSQDPTIDIFDEVLGSEILEGFDPGQSLNRSAKFTAPEQPGTYFYGACIEELSGEVNVGNNCSAAVTITVLDPLPDLLAMDAKSDIATITSGQSLSLSGTVANAGAVSAGPVVVRFVQSDDTTIDLGDQVLVRDQLEVLDAGQSTELAATITLSGQAGQTFLGICVDPDVNESVTDNNCSGPVTITLADPAPELAVDAVSADPTSVPSGGDFTLAVAISNNGTAPANTTLRYKLSADATIDPNDPDVGSEDVGDFVPGQPLNRSIKLNAPDQPGSYFYGACLDAVAGETDVANNCSLARQIDVIEDEVPEDIDLVVASVAADRLDPIVGETIQLTASVNNQGTTPSPDTTLRYLRSADAAISLQDEQVATAAIPVLAAGQSTSASASVVVPSQPGTFFFGACVDGLETESNPDNNCSGAVEVTVQSEPPPPLPPDLVVASLSANKSQVEPSENFNLAATVRNDGTLSQGSLLVYRFSTDATIDDSDSVLAQTFVPGLVINGTFSDSVSVAIPIEGNFFVGACVAVVAGEEVTENNCSAPIPVTVILRPPTEILAAVLPNSRSVPVGQTATVVATIVNTGAAEAANCRVDPPAELQGDFFYQATDPLTNAPTGSPNQTATIAANASQSFLLGLTPNQPLPPTELDFPFVCSNTAPAPQIPGVNTVLLSASPQTPCDIVSLAATPNGNGIIDVPVNGTSVFAVATSNVGGPCQATARITLRPPLVPLDASICETDPASGACRSVVADSVTLDVPAGASLAFGIFVRGRNQVVGLDPASRRVLVEFLDESGTVRGGTSVAVRTVGAPQQLAVPDLVVTSFNAANASVQPNQSFTVTASLSNLGAASAGTLLSYRAAAVPNIQNTGVTLAVASVPPLASGQAFTDSSSVVLGLQGRFFLGACVTPPPDEVVQTNNCSTAFEVVVAPPPPTPPDLVVTSFSAVGEGATGGRVIARAQVNNRGASPASATRVQYLLSSSPNVGASDSLLASVRMDSLAAGASDETKALLALPVPGASFLAVCVDAVSGETLLSNNCSTSVAITP